MKKGAMEEDEERERMVLKGRGGVRLSQMESDGRKVNSFARQEKIKGIDLTCQLRKSSLANTRAHNPASNFNIGVRHAAHAIAQQWASVKSLQVIVIIYIHKN